MTRRSLGLVMMALALGAPGMRRAVAQAPGARPYPAGFPVDSFQAHEHVALWMVAYDRCAWVTSDSLMAQTTPAEKQRLGAEWFCYESGGRWNAVYGRYDAKTDTFDAVAQYADTGSGRFARRAVAPPPDALPIARALASAAARLPHAAAMGRVRYNTFVSRSVAGPEVWLLPAWQPNGWLVWGVELRYAFDPTGRTVRDSTTVLTPIRGARPDTTMDLRVDSSSPDVPTVGETFFMIRYHALFHAVRVYTRRFATTLFDHGGTKAWLTVVRDTVPASVPASP